ncbi:hypothetical protein F4810DRAFT_670966 [Camillea tinctor]|nr:hypothetical protein F4810DRAFT_670966 [Camillea tinctor]
MRNEQESHGDDLPIALRRTPRRNSRSIAVTSATASPARSPSVTRSQKAADNLRSSATYRTPSKPKPKARADSRKRVRFSDPGLEVQENGSWASTGLTPMIRRSSLGGERAAANMTSPSHKRQKRHSAPVRRLADEDDEDMVGNDNVIRILPLRQILDDRIKRRIRRNGLSEEMNTICEAKRRRVQEQKAQLQRLKDELAEKDAEIGRLHGSSAGNNGGSTNGNSAEDIARIALLEHQVQELRNKLRERTEDDNEHEDDWSPAGPDHHSDSYMDMDTMDIDDDSGFGETTIAELVCSTPCKRKRPSNEVAPVPKSASASFPTPPSTSPPQPSTPSSTWRARPEAMTTPTRKALFSSSHNTGVQASLPDPEIEAELGSLRREIAKLTNTLESHTKLQSRMSSKLALATEASPSSEKQADTNNKDIESHLDAVLATLSDRTATLLKLDTSLANLGFPGADALSIVSSLASSFRTARLELEYLTPGELDLALSGSGAHVLDLIFTRLRDLGKQAHEQDAKLDEAQATEALLREQLRARVDAGDALAGRVRDLEARLRATTDGYKRDIRELEKVGEQKAEERDAVIRGLEARLEERKVELARLNKEHGVLLAHKDARVAEMRHELEQADRALREAQGTICRLRVENTGLVKRLEEEGRRAREVVAKMRGELVRVLGLGAEFLGLGGAGEKASSPEVAASTAAAAPAAPAAEDNDDGSAMEENVGERETSVESSSGVKMLTKRSLGSAGGVYLAGELARRRTSVDEGEKKGKGKGKKKRRYDSGLGFQDEDESDGELEGGIEMVA